MAEKGVFLKDLTWCEAEQRLTTSTVVVVPIGAAAKEHGPHLPLGNDWVMAEYLAQRVVEATDVVCAPTVGYHCYPAFLEYPGSVSLRLETARNLVIDICLSLAAYGPRRFYAVNTGLSTVRALKTTAGYLAPEGIVFRYTDIDEVAASTVRALEEQEGGSHADEIETSMMLYIAPELVDMSKACKDYHPGLQPGLTRKPRGKGSYSASGIYGDATLATREKGERVVEAMVKGILGDIERLRNL